LIKSLKTTNTGDIDGIKVDVPVPTIFNTTIKNLKAAISGEHYENMIMCPEFAIIAGTEGLSHIAQRLRAIANAETHHEERYKKLLNEVEAVMVFKKDKPVQWVVANLVIHIQA
jgi:rubrerythrin